TPARPLRNPISKGQPLCPGQGTCLDFLGTWGRRLSLGRCASAFGISSALERSGSAISNPAAKPPTWTTRSTEAQRDGNYKLESRERKDSDSHPIRYPESLGARCSGGLERRATARAGTLAHRPPRARPGRLHGGGQRALRARRRVDLAPVTSPANHGPLDVWRSGSRVRRTRYLPRPPVFRGDKT